MQAIAGLLARHVINGVGAALIAKGYISADALEAVIGGGLALGAAVWSYMQKRRSGAV